MDKRRPEGAADVRFFEAWRRFSERFIVHRRELEQITRLAPSKGARGVKRAGKKRRRRANAAKARRVTLCSFGEQTKKEGRS